MYKVNSTMDQDCRFLNQKHLVLILSCFLITFSIQDNNYAENLSVEIPGTVRLVYFRANDRPYRQEVVDSMKTVIRHAQTFYAEQMLSHGYEDTTFRFETDKQGEPLVHIINGQYAESHYFSILLDSEPVVANEQSEEFIVLKEFSLPINNIYFFVFDFTISSIPAIGGSYGKNSGAVQGQNGEFILAASESASLSLYAGEYNFYAVLHELGHAFGLSHDWRDGAYIMSYGPPGWDRLSACAADFLAVHPYFNPDIPTEDTPPPIIELISPLGYPTGSTSVSVRLKVSDPDGLHQVLLFGPGELPNKAGLRACQRLNGKREAIVEFDYDGVFSPTVKTNLFNTPLHLIHIAAVDVNGDRRLTSFELFNVSGRENHIATLSHELSYYNRDSSLAFSLNNETLASAYLDGTIQLWDVASQENIATLKGNVHENSIVALSPDSTLLAYGLLDGTIQLWDVASQESIATLEVPMANFSSLALSPDNTLLAYGLSDGGVLSDSKIQLWDVASQEHIATLEVPMAVLSSLAFSPDGTILGSGTIDGMIQLWDAVTGYSIASFIATPSKKTDREVSSVTFSHDGALLASITNNGVIDLWEVPPSFTGNIDVTTATHFDVVRAKITGPWLWMIAPTEVGQGGSGSINIDSLKKASGGAVTEKAIATNGAKVGDVVGDYTWTLGKIAATGGNNVNDTLNRIGVRKGDVNDHSSYALITLESATAQSGVTMHVGSDDAIKVWLNGEVVHTNPIDRPAYDFQEEFSVNLKKGENLLLVKVSELGGGWSMFVGIDANVKAVATGPPMYWIEKNSGTLHHSTGSSIENLIPDVRNATSIAVDVAATKLYWTEQTSQTTGRIRRANLDGSNVQLVKALKSVPLGLAIDVVKGKLYLSNSWRKLQRLNFDGSNFESNLITDLKSPKSLALDVGGNKIYWTEQTGETTGRIRRANLDGSNVQLVKALTSVPLGLAIDVAKGKLYLSNGWGKIQRMNFNGSNYEPNFITDLETPGGIAVDTTGGKLYWTEKGRIGCADLNGENIQEVVTGIGTPADFALGTSMDTLPAAPMNVSLAAFQTASPDETVLLSNYPNPFNPETWIPYQLANPAEVTLRIYAINGGLVRKLALGHQPAGLYQSKSRAAYWGGRNAHGEKVASGLYFYTLTADDFTATRKLLIRK